MIEVKQARLGIISKWEKERWDGRSEVSGLEEEIRELRRKLLDLDRKRGRRSGGLGKQCVLHGRYRDRQVHGPTSDRKRRMRRMRKTW